MFARAVSGRLRRGEPVLLSARYPRERIGVGSYGDMELLRYGNDGAFEMGAYCSIAKGVKVMLGGNHRPDWVTTYPFSALRTNFSHITGYPEQGGDVRIGSDVWIGREATIKCGITIGHGAIVATRAMVTKDVPPFAIVGGNPAKLIRYRFAPEIIERLLAVAWWDWSEERIMAAMPLLLNENIEAFLDMADGVDAEPA